MPTNRERGFTPSPKVPRQKRGPALMAKALKNRKLGFKPRRPIDPETGARMVFPGEKRVRLHEKMPMVYIQTRNGTLMRLFQKGKK